MKKFILLFILLLIPIIAYALNPFTDGPFSGGPWTGTSVGGPGGPFGSGTGVAYDFRDEFSDTLAAGSVHETLSTSGHVRTVVDTENKLSIANGALTFAGGKASPASGDPGIWWPSTARVAGKGLLFDYTTSNYSNIATFGFDTTQAGAVNSERFVLIGSGSIGVNPSVVVYTPVNSTNYKFAIFLRTTGDFYLIKDSTWKLIWAANDLSADPVYPGISNYNDTSTSSFIRIPSARFLPVPLISMGFD